MKQNQWIFIIIGIIALFLIGNQFGLFSTFNDSETRAYPLPSNGQEIHFVSPSSIFTTYLQGQSSCGDMSDANCGSGWEPHCFVRDCDECGTWNDPRVSIPVCRTCYYCVEEEVSNVCPSNAPYYCARTEFCYANAGRCECETKNCPSFCTGNVLSYSGICEYSGDGNCAYETTNVECCSDSDCGFGLICSGNICVQPFVDGKNLGFEEWSTVPNYWDISSNLFYASKEDKLSEGDFSLGLFNPGGTFQASPSCTQFVQATQQIDLTNIDELKFDSAYCIVSGSVDVAPRIFCCGKETGCAPNDGTRGSANKVKLYIGDDIYDIPQDYQETTIDVSSYNGLQTIKFYYGFCPSISGGWGVGTTFQKIDNIRLVGGHLALLEAELQKKIKAIEELEGNLEAQAQLLSDLEVSLDEKIQIVLFLTSEIEEQAILVSQLQLNLDEKIAIVSQLTNNINEQEIIIEALNLKTSEQLELIGQLDLTVQEQAELISSMELTLQEQADYINELNLNLQQKSYWIDLLVDTNEEQAELISLMELSFGDQAGIIQALNNEIIDDAEIISNLDLTVSEQAELILEMKLNLEEQAELIDSLSLSNEDVAELINNLELTISEQALLINNLNIELDDDAEIIGNLKLSLNEQADLIQELGLSLEEEAIIIAELNLKLEEEQILIDALKLTIAEQKVLIENLENYSPSFDFKEFFDNNKTVIFIILGFLGLLVVAGGKK